MEKGVAAERIEVIPNGVDIPAEVPEHRTANEVLYVGNFTQGASNKGFDILLTAWAEVSKVLGKAQLVMVGGGDASCWINFIRQLGCSDSVRFVGSVDDPSPFFASAELFVLPSRHEGMSNALLEAQSWGLPAVVSDISANVAV
ncbi:MAG: glycosyltransferase, partial [Candidatus Electrothrix sp. ATG2]|nr:glycosyltransferase [Candidatus Electrothrix sp. ATG2]